jgi:hypothetical protein
LRAAAAHLTEEIRMTAIQRRIGIAAFAAGLLGCTLDKIGPRNSTGCATMTACECLAASEHCESRTEGCWCPSECDPNISCVCGGGRFLACEERGAAWDRCDAQATRVLSLCAGTEFLDAVGSLCSTNPNCMTQCLGTLATPQSCAQIDCSFCSAGCDCPLPAMSSALRTCVVGCYPSSAP